MQLSELAAVATDGDGEYAVSPSPDWRQGRTAFGGLTAALCAHTAASHLGELPPLRELQIAYAGPAAGRVRLRPSLVRRGRSAAFVAVDAIADDGPCARATLTYGAARDVAVLHDRAAAPEVPSAAESTAVPGGDGPAFLEHFELRFASGALPFSEGEPAFSMWVRHRDEGRLAPEIALVAVGDVLPPAAAPAYAQRAPMSSMTWTLQLLRPAPSTTWYLLASSSDHGEDGYSQQSMGCWDTDGRCLALGRQTVALF